MKRLAFCFLPSLRLPHSLPLGACFHTPPPSLLFRSLCFSLYHHSFCSFSLLPISPFSVPHLISLIFIPFPPLRHPFLSCHSFTVHVLCITPLPLLSVPHVSIFRLPHFVLFIPPRLSFSPFTTHLLRPFTHSFFLNSVLFPSRPSLFLPPHFPPLTFSPSPAGQNWNHWII